MNHPSLYNNPIWNNIKRLLFSVKDDNLNIDRGSKLLTQEYIKEKATQHL